MYPDSFIEELLNCEKIIIDSPSKDYKEDRGQLKKIFSLQSSDGQYAFNAVIWGSIHFKENFSVGMNYPAAEQRGITKE